MTGDRNTDPLANPPTHQPFNQSPHDSTDEPPLAVGDRVRIIELPPYVKTADSMPMLRPPDVIQLGEEGTILERRSGNYWSVRFSKGVFLMENRLIERVSSSRD